MKPVCFIPARGGSKRIPHKNLKLFCGRPIMEYAIETAQKSGLFDRVIVSSDDVNILSIAERMGCQLDTREPELYADNADSEAIFAYCIKHYRLVDEPSICMMYSTAAFVRVSWLCNSYYHFDGNPIAVCKPVEAQRAMFLDNHGILRPIIQTAMDSRTQDLRTTYMDVGDFYWLRPKSFLEGWSMGIGLLQQNAKPFIVGKYESYDMDEPEDWIHGESEYRRMFGVS